MNTVHIVTFTNTFFDYFYNRNIHNGRMKMFLLLHPSVRYLAIYFAHHNINAAQNYDSIGNFIAFAHISQATEIDK